MYQKCLIIGRLGRDPELRDTPDGTPVCNFSVATDRQWTDRNGETQKSTVWFQVTAWRRMAETCHTYLSKGRLVMVEGYLSESETWKGKDGEQRASLRLTAFTVKFLGGTRDSDRREETDDSPFDDEEIPF